MFPSYYQLKMAADAHREELLREANHKTSARRSYWNLLHQRRPEAQRRELPLMKVPRLLQDWAR
jgi:hypothetical protein